MAIKHVSDEKKESVASEANENIRDREHCG